MGLLGDLLAWVTLASADVVARGGYAGILVLMAMESMIFPVPSEAVMPPAGILVAEGRLTLVGVVLASSAGSLLGSLLSYWIGLKGGEVLVRRWGRWFLLHERHLDLAHAFFEKRGVMAVFLARFVPGVRHVSSMPAGAARMALVPFCLATVAGATIWNGVLLWAGFVLRDNWERVLGWLEYAEIVAAVALVGGVAAWFWLRRRRPRPKAVV